MCLCVLDLYGTETHPGCLHPSLQDRWFSKCCFSSCRMQCSETWVLCCRSCYVVFPCQQIVLALGCLMGLVMFARYGEDSPLDKGYVKTNDQVCTYATSATGGCLVTE